MNKESFIHKGKEINYLQDLYYKEKKIVDDSRVTTLIRGFFSDKKINDLEIKESSRDKLGKYLVDVSWNFSKDENNKFCKTFWIRVISQDEIAVIANKKKELKIDKKDWPNEKSVVRKINQAFKNPFLRSANPFPYSTKEAVGY